MSRISNYRGWYQRKYIVGGNKKVEEEREIAQMCDFAVSSVDDDAKYTRFQENAPIFGQGYSQNYRTGVAGGYGAYFPGLVYLPDKYYTLKDAIPTGYYTMFGMDANATFKDWVELELSLAWFADESTAGLHFNKDYVFMYDEDFDYYLYFGLYVFSSPSTSWHLRKERSFKVSICCCAFHKDIDVSLVGVEKISGNTYGFVYWENGRLNPSRSLKPSEYINPGNNSISGASIFNYDGPTAYMSEHSKNLEKCFAILNKVKFYISDSYWDYNAPSNEPAYMYKNPRASTNSAHPSWLSIWVDISEAPYYPTNGFYVGQTIGAPMGTYITYDWENGGPDPSTPGERDDPNVDDPGYGPGQNPDDEGGDGDHDNTSDEIKPPGIPNLSASGAGLITIYNPSQSQLEALGRSLWSPTALEAIKQYFTNPMDTILGLSIVPVKPRTASSKEIMLGVYKSGVSAPVVDSDYIIINCGSIMINRYYGSYLDYSPYTKIKCYLPYIGEIDVNPDEVMTTSLMILYYVNVVTGDVVAMLCANENIIYTVAGNCVRQLPLSSTDYAAIINTAVNAVAGIATAAATAGLGSAGVAAAGASKYATEEGKALASARASANNVGSANNLIGDVMSAKFNYKHAGTIGTGSGQLSYQKPYLIIERPNLDLADNYKSFVGYPCNKTLQIGHCTGFTQIEASNLAVANATDEEVAEIKELLLGGVII